jgi:predicted GNAT family acetyltransferase
MTSLYARYLDERTDDCIIETDTGFVTYRRLNKNQMYIIDIYVVPAVRNHGVAKELGDKVCEIARQVGCNEIIGTVNPSCRGSNDSILVLISYGMEVFKSTDNIIYFRKGI